MMAKTIGKAGRIHLMGTGVQIGSIKVIPNGAGMRAMMKSEGAQEAVNSRADVICGAANSDSATPGARYVVHPRVLTVSAHAFVDPDNYAARLDEHNHMTLEHAFWGAQGG